jgi:hypothetical protein
MLMHGHKRTLVRLKGADPSKVFALAVTRDVVMSTAHSGLVRYVCPNP